MKSFEVSGGGCRQFVSNTNIRESAEGTSRCTCMSQVPSLLTR